MSIKTTKSIYNSQNEKMVEFPFDNLLSLIIDDLWNEIVKYMFAYPFILGDEMAKLDGYRKMRKDEFESYKNKLRDYHLLNSGIFRGFETHRVKDPLLLIDGYFLKSQRGKKLPNYDYVWCTNKEYCTYAMEPISSNAFVSDETTNGIGNDVLTLMIRDMN